RAAEIRPGSRANVHHVLAFVQPPGGWADRYGGFAANWIAATVPGARPTNYPDGMAKFVPAGSRFLFQIHYTTNGAPQTDRTVMGLVFADPKTVRTEVSTELVANPQLDIAPNESDYGIEGIQVIDHDSYLVDL